MVYTPLKIDRQNLTISGVPFANLSDLNSASMAIGSNMFEGFEPNKNSITIIRDYITNKITLAQLIQFAKQKSYVQ